MGTVFYIHRLSKLIDEMVRDLGLTLTLSDEKSDVKLAPHIDNMRHLANGLGIKMDHAQQPNGVITVTFSRK
jgi:hypothetical protein